MKLSTFVKATPIAMAAMVVTAQAVGAESLVTQAEVGTVKTDVWDTAKMVAIYGGLPLLGIALAAKAVPKIINKFF